MMQIMREKTQGIIAGIIVVLIALTFALWGVQNYLHGGGGTEPVAKVDGIKITQQDLHVAYEREKRLEMLTAGPGFDFDQKAQAKLKQDVLQKLINSTAIIHFAKKNGFGVGNQQLNLALTEMPIFQTNGQFSLEKFQMALANLGYTQTDFYAELEHNIILMQISKGIEDTNFILPNELATILKLQNQRRDFGYFILKPQKFTADVKVSDEAIRSYYNAHKDEFLTPEKVNIEYVILSADKIKQNIHPTEAQLKKYYQDHLASFSSLKNKQQPLPYAQVAARVKATLERQMLQEAFAEQNDKLTDLAYTNSDSLVPAASALGLEIKKTDLFTKTGEKSGVLANPKIVKAAFSETTLKQGYNSSPVELSPGEVIVLRVKEHIPEQTLPLDKVRTTILAKLTAVAAKQKSIALSKELETALQQGKTPQELATKNHLGWLSASNVTAQDHNINSQVLRRAFELKLPKNKEVSTAVIDLGDEGDAVIKLTNVVTPSAADKSEATSQFSNSLEHALGKYDLTLLKDAIMHNAKVKMTTADESKANSENQSYE